MTAKFTETKLYGGEVTLRFYPGNHTYMAWDEKNGLKGKRVSGVTGYTGVLNKGEGLMMYPMWEALKLLDRMLASTSVKDLIDGDLTVARIIEECRSAHVKKSSRGKGVGTKAHDWVENWLIALKDEHDGKKPNYPKKPTVKELSVSLKESYISTINRVKPKEIDDFRRLLKVLEEDFTMQDLIYQEAAMNLQAIENFLTWTKQVKIKKVIGAEEYVYSRKHKYGGKFDAVLDVEGVDSAKQKYSGVHMVDFKTSNTSSQFEWGIFPEYLGQTGLYDEAYCEEKREGWDKVKGELIVNIPKTTKEPFSFVSTDRKRNRAWGLSLIPAKEGLVSATKELKGAAYGRK